jgi:hypothetical protein
MAVARGIDYAWQHPSPAAIKAAGYDFVCRYYSRDPSKNLTRAEADALAEVGLWIVGNWEYSATDALRGHDGGVSDAQLARVDADGCGQPRSRPTYFSKDWDVTPAQEATVTDYDRGADSVLGVAQVGDYAGFYPLRVQRDAGVISWEWQPTAWSGGQWEPRVNIRQTGTAMVGGVQVDVNEAMTPDYGLWQPGRLPPAAGAVTIPRLESDMILHAITGSPDIWALSGSLYWHVVDPASLNSYKAAGVPQATITAAEHAAVLAAAEALKTPQASVTVTWPKSFTVTPAA